MAEFTIEINGSPKRRPDELIVESSLHHPDSVEVRWADQAKTMLKGIAIGDVMNVKGTAGATVADKLAEVEVTAVEAVLEGGTFYAVVRGLDKSHRLHRGTMTQTFEKQTAADAIQKVTAKSKVPAGKLEKTDVKHDHLIQFNENPWSYVRRSATDANRMVTVGPDGKVILTKFPDTSKAPAASAKDDRVLRLYSNITQLHATLTSAQQVSKVEVRGWDMKQKKELVGKATPETKSAKLDKGWTPSKLSTKFGDAQHVITAPNFHTQAEVTQAAQSLGARLASGMVEIHGEVAFNPKLRAGVAVTIADVGDHFDGKYVLSAVRHIYDSYAAGRTEFSITGSQDRSLAGTVTGGMGNGTADGKLFGIYPAIVSDNKDKEGLARVKVKYPWLDKTAASDWARIVYPGGGKDRGLWFLPTVNDEVAVAFENGDPNRPYVLGGLYNGKDKVPVDKDNAKYEDRGKTTQFGLATDKLRMHLTDKPGEQTLVLGTRDKKFQITLSTKDGIVKIESDGKVEITGKGDITIKSKTGAVNIEAKTDLVMKSGAKFSAKATAGAAIDGGPKLDVKGGMINIG